MGKRHAMVSCDQNSTLYQVLFVHLYTAAATATAAAVFCLCLHLIQCSRGFGSIRDGYTAGVTQKEIPLTSDLLLGNICVHGYYSPYTKSYLT